MRGLLLFPNFAPPLAGQNYGINPACRAKSPKKEILRGGPLGGFCKTKSGLIITVACVSFVLAGCETLKGAGQGLVRDSDNTYENVSTGIPKVWKKITTGIDSAYKDLVIKDDWMEENLW